MFYDYGSCGLGLFIIGLAYFTWNQVVNCPRHPALAPTFWPSDCRCRLENQIWVFIVSLALAVPTHMALICWTIQRPRMMFISWLLLFSGLSWKHVRSLQDFVTTSYQSIDFPLRLCVSLASFVVLLSTELFEVELRHFASVCQKPLAWIRLDIMEARLRYLVTSSQSKYFQFKQNAYELSLKYQQATSATRLCTLGIIVFLEMMQLALLYRLLLAKWWRVILELWLAAFLPASQLYETNFQSYLEAAAFMLLGAPLWLADTCMHPFTASSDREGKSIVMETAMSVSLVNQHTKSEKEMVDYLKEELRRHRLKRRRALRALSKRCQAGLEARD